MSILTEAAQLIKEGKILILGISPQEIALEVGKETVRLIKKPGRTIITCSCENHTRNCNQPPICKHKAAGITYITMRKVKW